MLKAAAVFGIFSCVVFIVGLMTFLFVNPIALEELNNVSLFSYNLEGMDARLWAITMIYIIPGLLGVFFSIAFFFGVDLEVVIVIGDATIFLASLIWLSFGIWTFVPGNDLSIHFMLIRTIAFLLTDVLSLIFFASIAKSYPLSSFAKWVSFIAAALVLILLVYGVTSGDDTWLRTNLSVVIYFVWLGLFSATALKQMKSVVQPQK